MGTTWQLNNNNSCAVSHCCFNMSFPHDIRCGASFNMLIYYLYIFFGEVSVNVLAHFLTILVVSYLLFQYSLYILDNSSLSDVFFASIFSHHMAFPFILLSVFCGEHKSLILVKFSLSIIFFMDHAFSVVSKNPLPYPTSSRFFF